MTQIEEIKQKVGIVDLVGQYVSLKKSGRNYKGICPFHSEKTPSFMVSEELGIFKCFGCGKAGDVFAFLQEIEGIEFPDALKKLADRAGVVLKDLHADPNDKKRKIIYEINHLASEFYHYLLVKHAVGKAGLTYLKQKRKLTDETVKSFKLGVAPDSWDVLYQFLVKKKYEIGDIAASGLVVPKKSGQGYIDKFRNRIMFPLVGLDGKILGFTGRVLDTSEPKYLNSPDTLVFNKSLFVYALDKAKTTIKKEGAVFVEGQMDVISAYQAGLTNVVASSGTSLTAGQLKAIAHYTKDLTLCFDSDTAGSFATYRAIDLAEKQSFNVSIALLPEKIKDLDELVQRDKKIPNKIPAYDFYFVSALKRNDKTSSIGKKKIVEELVPVFSSISNKVTLDHYIKKISEELNINEDVISQMFVQNNMSRSSEVSFPKEDTLEHESKKSPEGYMLALLFKAPLDNIDTFMYVGDHKSLDDKDFTDSKFGAIFIAFKKYCASRKGAFDIKYFSDSLTVELKEKANELYLWDLDYVTSEEKRLRSELESTFLRIKDLSKRKNRLELSQKIKQAEMEKNDKLVKELTRKFEELS